MKPATIAEIRRELQDRDTNELADMCLRLGRFKKDNKELLSYLLFEAHNETAYIESIKLDIDEMMAELNTRHIYFVKKGLQKILRQLNKNIRYSGNKQTLVEILLYFCKAINDSGIPIERSTVITNMYERQKAKIRKTLLSLHEDLQAGYMYELDQ
mgnify:CR=1 FL=1